MVYGSQENELWPTSNVTSQPDAIATLPVGYPGVRGRVLEAYH
jgi:hypothetical protein